VAAPSFLCRNVTATLGFIILTVAAGLQLHFKPYNSPFSSLCSVLPYAVMQCFVLTAPRNHRYEESRLNWLDFSSLVIAMVSVFDAPAGAATTPQ
jgi:hypothetical protein